MQLIYNFIIDCSDDELPCYLNIDFEKQAANIVSSGILSWCLQTYHMLHKRGNLNVVCSNKLMLGAINIVHSDQLLRIKGSAAYFIVCVCADFPKRGWAHYQIVQNKNQLAKNTSFISHWLQPGLIKRDPTRNIITQVAYAGQSYNGNLAETPEFWEKLLEPYGLKYVTLDSSSWHDLSHVDVLIGVRSLDTKPHDTKPPTKLFNAWHANIPFIGGFDSAFEQVGKPGVNYIRVETHEEVIKAILRLKDEPGYYARIVENGFAESKKFSRDTIAGEWEAVLTKEILQRYNKWKHRHTYERLRYFIRLKLGITEHVLKTVVKKVVRTN